MANLPNITSMEVAVVSAGMLLFFVCPALLALADQRRRRKLQAPRDWEPSVTVPAVVPSDQELESEAPSTTAPEAVASGSDMAAAPDETPVPAPATTLSPEGGETANEQRPMEIQPLDGSWRHSFRLQDLHEARLPDWPPAAIRDDPEGDRLWHEGERACDQHHAVLSATVRSPYPARSRCLGAVEVDGSTRRLRVLLFPVVWPVSQNQAVAQVVFEINPDQNLIHGWVDALRAHELTEDNRRDIRACGDDA
jgi:hypothetical protein